MKKTNCTSPATEGLKSFEALRREAKENGISDSPWKRSTRRSTLYAMAKIRLRVHLICKKNLYSHGINPNLSLYRLLPVYALTKDQVLSFRIKCCDINFCPGIPIAPSFVKLNGHASSAFSSHIRSLQTSS